MSTFLSRVEQARYMIANGTMTAAHWASMSQSEREASRSTKGWTSQLVGFEGCRVEVVDCEGDKPRRFNVGRSCGWVPCHLEIYNSRSHGGPAASSKYHSVRMIRRIR
jgi:hypothetical protein